MASRRGSRRRQISDDSEDEANDLDASTQNARGTQSINGVASNVAVGKIFSVSVENFVTYDKVCVYPNDYLNIIIGANGTGKSTLVAAIVLGMGGSPVVLSRSSKIQDYIKNGKDEATIEITLLKNVQRDRIVFERTFDNSGNHAYGVDGRNVSHREYNRQVAQFNIQVDNLCQFLPQDRVQDFTKMDPKELLINTQSSVCSEDIINTLEELKKLRDAQKNGGKELSDNLIKLREHETRFEVLHAQFEQMQSRKALASDFEMCSKRKAWIEFEDLYRKYKEVEDDLKTANENHKKAEDEMRPLVVRSTQIDSMKKTYDDNIKSEMDKQTKHSSDLSNLKQKSFQHTDALLKAKSDLAYAQTEVVERKREIDQAVQIQNALLLDLKNATNSAGSESDIKAETDRISAEIETINGHTNKLFEKRRTITRHIDDTLRPEIVAIERKIAVMENMSQMKLEHLRTKYDNVYRGVIWLRRNLHLFKGKVYEPMILELNVRDRNHAKYFENVIAIRDLITFTCEQKDDVELLFQKLRNEEKLNINIAYVAPSQQIQFKPKIPIADLKKFGFTSYLLDLIEGPIPILNHLCKLNQLHNIPLGSNQTYDLSDKIPSEISLFFTPNHRFVTSQSKYSGLKSSTSNEISGRNLLNLAVDAAALAEQKQLLTNLIRKQDRAKNERLQIESKMQELEDKVQEFNAQRTSITQKLGLVDQCKDKLKRHMQKITNLKNNIINVDAEKEKFQNLSRKIIKELSNFNQKAVEVYGFWQESQLKYDLLREKYLIFTRNNAEIENQIRDAKDAVDRAKSYIRKITDVLDRTKSKCTDKQNAAKQLTNGKTPSDKNFPFKNEFSKLPNTMDELMAHMDEIQGQIDCMGQDNAGMLEEYESRKGQIAQLKALIDTAVQRTSDLEENMSMLHALWYPKIQEVVSVVNTNFSNFMSSMGFAGEVELIRNAERDYSEYGIEIRVKYRHSERLQALDRFVQSGGERAVAIAIYTISLQQLTHVPFRCVDEINQGMDPTNERKIFEMLLDQIAQPGKSQYFFVTPKLLSNLPYNNYMTVHDVHNGKFINDRTMFETVPN